MPEVRLCQAAATEGHGPLGRDVPSICLEDVSPHTPPNMLVFWGNLGNQRRNTWFFLFTGDYAVYRPTKQSQPAPWQPVRSIQNTSSATCALCDQGGAASPLGTLLFLCVIQTTSVSTALLITSCTTTPKLSPATCDDARRPAEEPAGLSHPDVMAFHQACLAPIPCHRDTDAPYASLACFSPLFPHVAGGSR
jgi:hypothetical protein